jgi:hypothetical protein
MEINIFQLKNKHRKLTWGGQGGFHPQEDLLLSYFQRQLAQTVAKKKKPKFKDFKMKK